MSDGNHSKMFLQGKVGIITGSARGIGATTAKKLALYGAHIILADINENGCRAVADQIAVAGGVSHVFPLDLNDDNQLQALTDFAFEKFSKIDFLINNARPRFDFTNYYDIAKEWDLAINVLLKAPAFLSRYVIPKMIDNGGGSIVNISSMNAFFISQQPASYHIAKSGLLQLTKYLAHEFGKKNIRVNAVCPGLVDIPDEKRILSTNPDFALAIDLAVPLQRAACDTEIAELIAFLISPSASYLNGEIITIDGGAGLSDHFNLARNVISACDNRAKFN